MSASGGSQTSMVYEEAGHGLFTFYLLKALSGDANIDSDRKNITINELYQYVSKNVTLQSRRKGGEQDPEITPWNDQLKKVNLIELPQ